jgi:serine/threonine protein kinase
VTQPNDPSDQLDETLIAIIEGMLEEARAGRLPDWAQMEQQNPTLIREIRELWATAMIAEDFAEFSRLGQSESGSASVPTSRIVATTDGVASRIGDYELLEEIGRGGMGVVYRARQVSLNRIVALKMLLRGSLASNDDVARFRAEAEAAARLNHPNIIPVYEIGEYQDQEQPFFSMKYIEGQTLAQRLADGPIPAREAAEILLPIAQAIATAHKNGVLHRDVKSSNILIDEDRIPYLSDFGLAKRVHTQTGGTGKESLTQSGAIIGTPSYMSPEQAAGQRVAIGPAADVYSLGACLYAMLTGHPPFQAASPVDVLLMVLEQDPLPPRVVNPAADRDLEMIALKCLQKPIDLRYDSANSLAGDLQAFLAHEPISARSSHFTQIVSRAFRETHHAQILEHWGLLWILHSIVLLVLCLVTNWIQLLNIESRWPYLGLWVVGLGLWAALFWNLRRRSGPITFIERQIAHVWAGSMIASTLLFAIEALLGLRVLQLSPVLGLVSGMVFLAKAGILSGRFYIQAVVLFLTSIGMAVIPYLGWPNFSLTFFGVVSAACFLLPGLKYYRQNRDSVCVNT